MPHIPLLSFPSSWSQPSMSPKRRQDRDRVLCGHSFRCASARSPFPHHLVIPNEVGRDPTLRACVLRPAHTPVQPRDPPLSPPHPPSSPPLLAGLILAMRRRGGFRPPPDLQRNNVRLSPPERETSAPLRLPASPPPCLLASVAPGLSPTPSEGPRMCDRLCRICMYA